MDNIIKDDDLLEIELSDDDIQQLNEGYVLQFEEEGVKVKVSFSKD